MKRHILTTLVIFAILFTSFNPAYATEPNLSKYNLTMHNNDDKTIIVGAYGKQLYTKECYLNLKEVENIHTFESNIIDYCVLNEKIYVLNSSKIQKKLYHLSIIENNELKEKINFVSDTLSNRAKISVDNQGTFYIYSIFDNTRIFNHDGNLMINTEKFNKILTFNGICYGLKNNNLHQLSTNGIVKTLNYNSGNTLYKVSENFACSNDGSLFTFKGNSLVEVMDLDTNHPATVCETDKHIVCVSNDTLKAYNKFSGEPQELYDTNSAIYNISAYQNMITVLYRDYSFEVFNTETIFNNSNPAKYTQNTASTKSKDDKITRINGKKFLFIEQGTTIAKFKKNKKYKGFIISFREKESGVIGTGMNVTIKNDKSLYTYTTIVRGDVTGEGNVNSRDINEMFAHLLEDKKLQAPYRLAGDLNKDGSISNTDLVLVTKIMEN